MVITWAYACMVSMSSCALKRQNSVQVTSSDRVPPGAVKKHIFLILCVSCFLHTTNEFTLNDGVFTIAQRNKEHKSFPEYYKSHDTYSVQLYNV